MRWLWSAVVAVLLLAPDLALAQAAGSIGGTVTDESKAVLPGVTVTATDVSTGRAYVGVTDERGHYQLAGVAPGTYRLQAELTGFSTVVIPQLELLTGQNASVPFLLKVATLEETVTVSGEAPLVDTSSARVADNVDRRQMEALPLQGRDWIELALIVKGVTGNDVGNNRPGVGRDDQFQLNLDGQQVTYRYGGSGFGQPKFSRDAIAELRVETNLFDIAEGRSTGLLIQAISRSGSNTLHGSLYGFFRDDKFYAEDFVAKRVLPFSNQQVGGTLGGPVRRDRLHYFASYETEREPFTWLVQPTGFPLFSAASTTRQHNFLGRVDQVAGSGKDHLSYRGSYWRFHAPTEYSSSSAYPGGAYSRTQINGNAQVTWARTWSQNLLQEVRVGFNRYHHPTTLVFEKLLRQPNLAFPSVTIGTPTNFPQDPWENDYSVRANLTWHRGQHEWKIGGEVIDVRGGGFISTRGTFTMLDDLSPAELQRRFSNFEDPSSWDLSGLDPLVQRLTVGAPDGGVGSLNLDGLHVANVAFWLGDTWRVGDRLTVNYGVRYDNAIDVFNPPDVPNRTIFAPWAVPLFRTGIQDNNNFAGRAGFSWALDEDQRSVIRGGSGIFYSVPQWQVALGNWIGSRTLVNTFTNDGAAGFIENPTRNFTAEQIAAGNTPQNASPIGHDSQVPRSIQSSIGFQRQVGPVTGLDLTLAHSVTKNLQVNHDVNLFFDPQTGYNRDPRFGRPDPNWGQVSVRDTIGTEDSLMLISSLTRRLHSGFQAQASYTLTFYNRSDTGNSNNPFDLADEWGPADSFQRHTVRANAVVELPWEISLASSYMYGSGSRFTTSVTGRPFGKPGTNRLNVGAPITIPESLLDRWDGPSTVPTGGLVPVNALIGTAIHKVDLRVTKTFPLPGRVRLQAIAEVFNLFNHENFGSFVGVVNAPTFGQPLQSRATTYTPRAAQFALRMQF